MENGTLEIRNFLVLARLLGFLYKKNRVWYDFDMYISESNIKQENKYLVKVNERQTEEIQTRISALNTDIIRACVYIPLCRTDKETTFPIYLRTS